MLQTEDHPIKTIMDLSCLLRRAMEQEMEEFKLSSIQSRILGFLWYKRNHHEKAFQKELESEFKIRRSSVTSVIQGLEKHGLVERRSVSTDARQKELVLTEEGVRVQRQVIERIEEMEKRVDALMTVPDTELMFLPSLGVVSLQLFAYYIALQRGCDIDKPRNLAKSVTVE